MQAGTCDRGLFSIATAIYSSTIYMAFILESVPPVTNVPTPLQMFPSRKNHIVPCAEVKVRWKESEVAIQRFFHFFLIVGYQRLQSILKEPWWNAQGVCLQWYHQDCVASVPEDAAREL